MSTPDPFRQTDTETKRRKVTVAITDVNGDPIVPTAATVYVRDNLADADVDAVQTYTDGDGLDTSGLASGYFLWTVTAGDLPVGEFFWHTVYTLPTGPLTPAAAAGRLLVERPSGCAEPEAAPNVGAVHIANSGLHLPLPIGAEGEVLSVVSGVAAWDAAAGNISAVTGAAPITSTGGATPEIGITAATTGAAGSMSSADKTKLDGIDVAASITTHNTGPSHSSTVTTTNVATTYAIALGVGVPEKLYKLTMTADTTFSFTGLAAGASATIALSGAFVPTISGVTWPSGGTAPTYATPAVLSFVSFDGSAVRGFNGGQGFA